MHGTGFITAIGALMSGGAIVTLTAPSFDASELWETVEKHQVESIAIVGDAFAKPMLRALEENPGRWDTSSLVSIISSGVMWSKEIKAGLCKHIPQIVLMDSFRRLRRARLRPLRHDRAGRYEHREIRDWRILRCLRRKRPESRSREAAYLALSPARVPSRWVITRIPKNPPRHFAQSMACVIRFRATGATVEADGSLTLLGRGSVCINTAGEKVYPEEVEEVLKTHPAIGDALVVGVTNEKWGQAVTAVVHLNDGVPFDEQAVKDHVRDQLAGYKTPKAIHPTENTPACIQRQGRLRNGESNRRTFDGRIVSNRDFSRLRRCNRRCRLQRDIPAPQVT